MSDKCGNYDCADKSQYVKKGNTYGVEIVETQSYTETIITMDVAAAENDGKCKCGSSCSCVDCKCGH